MKRSFLILAIAALAAAGLGPDRAAGDNDVLGALDCPSEFRISKDDATCMNAWWRVTQPASTGIEARSTYGAESFCASYGTVKAYVDKVDHDDLHFALTNPGTVNSINMPGEVRAITCCLSQSDLCYKSQVEADADGFIARIEIDGGTATTTAVDVSTHRRRYKFCQANPADVYCAANPSGDALTEPPGPADGCGGRACVLQDCFDKFEYSPAATGESACSSLAYTPPIEPEGDHDDDTSTWPLTDNTCWISSASCAVA